MTKLVFSMMQSLDGYVDHEEMRPDPKLFQHFVEEQGNLAGNIYGRKMYEIMRYWDEDQDDWGPEERAFAAAWRRSPKWVVSKSLEEVGPNATLVDGDIAATVRRLKDELDGEIAVAGPVLAASLGKLGLIDEYRPHLRPFALGAGRPFFVGALPSLRLVASDTLGQDTVRLTYVPA
jgi:dihydrofolate reductase